MDRRFRWPMPLIAAALLGAAAFAAIVFLPFLTRDHSPYDYGPLHGKPAVPPVLTPTSSVDTGSFVVECHSYLGRPVVISSRSEDGTFVGAWELLPMTVDGRTVAQVGSCELTRSKKKTDRYVVHGTTGYEHVTLYFDWSGRFIEYFFSW